MSLMFAYFTGGSSELYAVAASTISVLLALIGAVFLLAVLLTVIHGNPVKKAAGIVVSGMFFVSAVVFHGMANNTGATIGEVFDDNFIMIYAIALMTVIFAFTLVLVAGIERFNRWFFLDDSPEPHRTATMRPSRPWETLNRNTREHNKPDAAIDLGFVPVGAAA